MQEETITAIAYRALYWIVGKERFADWLQGKRLVIVGQAYIEREEHSKWMQNVTTVRPR